MGAKAKMLAEYRQAVLDGSSVTFAEYTGGPHVSTAYNTSSFLSIPEPTVVECEACNQWGETCAPCEYCGSPR